MKFRFTLIILLTFYINSFSQKKYNLPIVGSIDTTKVATKSVYKLFNNYLNNSPDSLNFRTNPYWDKKEINEYLNQGIPYFDESSGLMYRNQSAKEHLSFYEPKILAIEQVEPNLYTIKTLYYNESHSKDSIYGRWNPPYITKHYCEKQGKQYFLKNSIGYETRHWNKYKFKMINYYIHPNLKFDKRQAKTALDFIEKTCKQYNLPIPKKINYYCTSTSEELGKLFNFSYMLSYMTGVTNKFSGRIIIKDANYKHIHELSHILFNNPQWKKESRPLIVNEGLSTFLGGTDGKKTFSENLKEWAKEVRKVDKITLEDIVNNKYRHQTDNTPIYVTGGYIFKLVYKKHKEKGVVKLFNCGRKKEQFEKTIEELFNMPYEKFNTWIINEIKKEK